MLAHFLFAKKYYQRGSEIEDEEFNSEGTKGERGF